MRQNRFFGQFDFSERIIKNFDKELVNQLKNVLRLKTGDEVVLCDGRLNEARAAIESIDNSGVVFKILEVVKNSREFSQNIILYCSLLKRENFELVIQKAVELGVKEIVPVIAERTVKLGLKTERTAKIIKEAAEQSGRGILPVLSESLPFEAAVVLSVGNDLNLFFEPGQKPLSGLSINFSKYKKIGIFIGPEGGWSETELKVAGGKFKLAGLSPFVLRAETAAISSLAAVSQLLQ